MAGRGFPPQETKRRRNVDPIPTTEVVRDEEEVVRGPELPSLPGVEWHPMTVRLWDAMRRSPLMANEDEVAWLFLIDTALMHSSMWTKGRWEHAAELRQRMAKFGITPEDRQRLRIKITTGKVEPMVPNTESDAAKRRAKLHVAG